MPYHKRHIAVLDVLRGFAISGLIFANILALGGFKDASSDVQAYFSAHLIDQWILFFTDVFLRYKFYTLFSLLFGMGFSILLARAQNNQQFVRAYIIRLFILFSIGWLHALFFLDGDILRIYAIAGFCLLFFKDLSNKKLLMCALISFSIPVLFSIIEHFDIYYFNPTVLFAYSSEQTIDAFQQGPWSLFIASNYERTLYYLADNLTSRRFFKIFGLFLLGFYLGRMQLFHQIKDHTLLIARILPWAWGFSLTTNILYTMFDSDLSPIARELFYIISVYPLTFSYIITIIYLCRNLQGGKIARWFAAVGRMSLSNFIAESVLAGFFILWYGLGLAAQLHVREYYLIAIMILMTIFISSQYWMRYFRFGPLEYIVRRWSR